VFSFWKKIKTKTCEHPGFSFTLAANLPSYTRCHFCNKVEITFVTDEVLVPGTGHMKTLRFWVFPDPELERALKTSPREYGNLKVEKWLRRQKLIS